MVWFNIVYSQNDRPDIYKWMDMPDLDASPHIEAADDENNTEH